MTPPTMVENVAMILSGMVENVERRDLTSTDALEETSY